MTSGDYRYGDCYDDGGDNDDDDGEYGYEEEEPVHQQQNYNYASEPIQQQHQSSFNTPVTSGGRMQCNRKRRRCDDYEYEGP